MPFEKEWRQPASSIPTNWSFHRLQSLGFAVESFVSWGSLGSSGELVWILSCSWLLVWILLSSNPIVWILFSCWLLVSRLLSCCLFAWSKGVRSPSILFQLPYQATEIYVSHSRARQGSLWHFLGFFLLAVIQCNAATLRPHWLATWLSGLSDGLYFIGWHGPLHRCLKFT